MTNDNHKIYMQINIKYLQSVEHNAISKPVFLAMVAFPLSNLRLGKKGANLSYNTNCYRLEKVEKPYTIIDFRLLSQIKEFNEQYMNEY